jgi:hypothetical protein
MERADCGVLDHGSAPEVGTEMCTTRTEDLNLAVSAAEDDDFPVQEAPRDDLSGCDLVRPAEREPRLCEKAALALGWNRSGLHVTGRAGQGRRWNVR